MHTKTLPALSASSGAAAVALLRHVVAYAACCKHLWHRNFVVYPSSFAFSLYVGFLLLLFYLQLSDCIALHSLLQFDFKPLPPWIVVNLVFVLSALLSFTSFYIHTYIEAKVRYFIPFLSHIHVACGALFMASAAHRKLLKWIQEKCVGERKSKNYVQLTSTFRSKVYSWHKFAMQLREDNRFLPSLLDSLHSKDFILS